MLCVSEVYQAASIRQAKEVFRRHRVDLLLCDIELCQENGLDLVEWVNENYTGVRSVIISCHRDFNYAQRALRIGTADYCVKALTYDELEAVLTKVVRTMAGGVPETRLKETSAAESATDIVTAAQTYILGNIRKEMTRGDIAGHAHVHPDYLNRLFKQTLGMTLMDYYIRERMLYAKELLQAEGMTVTKAAAALGYSNFSHFSRAFKRVTGMNPVDFKRC
jgi:YesN/AraC family two-component response regulator